MRPKRENVSISSLTMMGISKKFAKMTLDDFQCHNQALRDVKDTIEDFTKSIEYTFENGKGIFFYGSNGVGKSMLASLILKEAYTYRYTCRRVTFSVYVAEYTKSWGTKSIDDKELFEQEFFEQYKGVEFLVLEEIGKEVDSKIAKPILEDLLRYREEKGLITIICTNLTLKNLEELYGPSVVSLIHGNMTPIKIVSEDRRKSK